MNTTRLRELCDAFDAGALLGDEMRELVGLAREAADDADRYQRASDELRHPERYDYRGIK